jgi:hypothetical protein
MYLSSFLLSSLMYSSLSYSFSSFFCSTLWDIQQLSLSVYLSPQRFPPPHFPAVSLLSFFWVRSFLNHCSHLDLSFPFGHFPLFSCWKPLLRFCLLPFVKHSHTVCFYYLFIYLPLHLSSNSLWYFYFLFSPVFSFYIFWNFHPSYYHSTNFCLCPCSCFCSVF